MTVRGEQVTSLINNNRRYRMSDEIDSKQAKALDALQQAGYEIDFVDEDQSSQELPRRTIGIGLVVDKHRELPEAAYNIAEFTNILREQVGEFDDIEIGVQINPQGNKPKEQSKFMGFVQTDNQVGTEDEEYLDDDEEDIDMKTFRMNKGKQNHK